MGLDKDWYNSRGTVWSKRTIYGVDHQTLEIITYDSLGEYDFYPDGEDDRWTSFVYKSKNGYDCLCFHSKYHRFFRTEAEAVNYAISKLDGWIDEKEKSLNHLREVKESFLEYKDSLTGEQPLV